MLEGYAGEASLTREKVRAWTWNTEQQTGTMARRRRHRHDWYVLFMSLPRAYPKKRHRQYPRFLTRHRPSQPIRPQSIEKNRRIIDKQTKDLPSKFLLILVRGKRESRSSNTTSVRRRIAGSILANCVMWPGYHDGGTGRIGKGIF